MTAPDPRLEEIEARLARREAMVEDGSYKLTRTRCNDPEREGFHHSHPQQVATETLHHDSYISHLEALADHVAYLLAELRKAQDKLGRVEGLADMWTKRGEHDMAYSKTIPDEDIAMAILTEGASMVENARHIRNAIRAAVADATGGGE